MTRDQDIISARAAHSGNCCVATGGRRLGPLRVKMRKTRAEHMSSGMAPIADMREPRRHFRDVPRPDSCTAQKSGVHRQDRTRLRLPWLAGEARMAYWPHVGRSDASAL